MQLYTYYRSTAAYRVRIALNLKAIEAEYKFVNLVKDGGEQHKTSYRSLNPHGLVPVLVHDGAAISQSLAIIDFLEHFKPMPPLLPSDPMDRAWVKSLALGIACDIHPLNNLRVLKYLEHEVGVTENVKLDWYHHWVKEGFTGLEAILSADPRRGTFCFGESPGLADICLVAQVFNARRFGCDMTLYPTIQRINDSCLELPEFANAAPERQADAVD